MLSSPAGSGTDPDTLETSEKTVLETYVRKVDRLVHLVINGEEIVTTDNHPFYVQSRGFIEAGRLLVGDRLINVDGKDLIVEVLEIEQTEEHLTVYNFKVEDYHTYFVGENAVWVHNKCTREKPRIEDGNDREGWQHIENRHITGSDPGGDLFAPGTTREQLERAANTVVKKVVELVILKNASFYEKNCCK